MLASPPGNAEGPSSNFPSECPDLLQRDYFDWAEDVEDEVHGNSTDFLGNQMDSSPEFPAENPQAETINVTCGDETVEDGPMEVASPAEDQSKRTGPNGDRDLPLIVSSPSSSPSTDGDEVSSAAHEFSQTGMDVSQEFAWRAYCTCQDHDIHHFNWLGSPVYEYSWTPPAISLFYLLSNPKIPQPGDEYRLQSILSRATTYIDPVLVYLVRGLDDLGAKGYELIHFATARTFKFYTPHGQWAHDNRETADQTAFDDGDVYTYISPSLATGNGFAEICPIRSRYKWTEAQDELLAASQAFNGNLYRSKARARDYKPSPLRQSIVPEDLISERTVKKADESHACATGYGEEAQDPVESLPTITASRKTFFRQYACSSSSGGSLKRCRSSFDLKSEANTFGDFVHDRTGGFVSAKNSENCSSTTRIESSSVTVTSWKSSTERDPALDVDSGSVSEAKDVVGLKLDHPGMAAGIGDVEKKSELNSSQSLTRCEMCHRKTYVVPGLSNGIIRTGFRDPFQSGGTSEHPEASTHRRNTTAWTDSCSEFDPTIEFVSKASEVQFTSIRSQIGHRRRSTLSDWKSKWKEQRASGKTRSRLRKTPPTSPSQSSSSNSSTSTPHSDTWGSLQSGDIPAASVETEFPEQHIIVESELTQEYVSVPAPVFGVHPNEAAKANDALKKPTLGSKISAKGRSFWKKVKDGLRRPSNTDTGTRRRPSLSKFMVAGCSVTGHLRSGF